MTFDSGALIVSYYLCAAFVSFFHWVFYLNYLLLADLVSRGVPQGSILSPILFLIYMLPLGQIIQPHGLNLHIYADDAQIYLPAQPNSVFPPISITFFLWDLKRWCWKLLETEWNKTEIVLVGPKSLISSQNDTFIHIMMELQ